jgi:hypothetical protein
MKNERVPLRFKGAPTRVLATVELAEAYPTPSVCRVTLPETGSLPVSVRPLRSAAPMISLLSFRLPKSTPPGSYAGDMELGEKRIPIVVDVESRRSLRFIHSKFTHKGMPGAKIKTQLTLLNRGNVSITVSDEDTFCVFDDGGVARAFYLGLVEEDSGGKQRLDRIMDELAKAHGGLVRVTVTKGVGRVAPEEVRELEVEMHFSRRLIGGHTYRGTWSVSGASLEVEIEVLKNSAGGRGTHAKQ